MKTMLYSAEGCYFRSLSGEKIMMMTLYSRPGCIPCDALKKLFTEHGITYTEVRPIDLSEEERQKVFAEIVKVSTIPEPSVPAVRIDHGDHSHWVSNSGKEDVADMFKEVQRLLKH